MKGEPIAIHDLVSPIVMKRAILVFVLLTIVVTLPPLYLQWAESQRQQQIHEVKQRARPILGEPQVLIAEYYPGSIWTTFCVAAKN